VVDILIAEHLYDTIRRQKYARNEPIVEAADSFILYHVFDHPLDYNRVLYNDNV
jgi:hypothetical protein